MICLLARADQSAVDVALLASAVGSAVAGGVGWFGVLLVVMVVLQICWCGGDGVSQVVVVFVVVGGSVVGCDDHVGVAAL